MRSTQATSTIWYCSTTKQSKSQITKSQITKSLKTPTIQVELAMRADVSHSKELAHVLEAFKAARLAEVI